MKRRFRLILIFLALAIIFSAFFSSGCRKAERVVLRLYCNETFWFVMQEEAKAFEQIYGVRIELVSIRPRPSWQWETDPSKPLTPQQQTAQNPPPTPKPELDTDIADLIFSLSENRNGDFYLTDSALELGRLKSLLLSSYEYPFCFQTMSLLVPKGNPMQFHSVRDVLIQKKRLGITNPAKDGAGMMALEIVSKLSDSDWTDCVQVFDWQDELFQALEDKKIDAALIWDSTNLKTYLATKYSPEYYVKYQDQFDQAKQKWNTDEMTKLIEEMYSEIFTDKDFAEKIPLVKTSNGERFNEHRVIQVSLIILCTTLHDANARRFVDFLISRQGREILLRHGFFPKQF
jgi:ABC-type molybdate transport system substrate-binding protein